MEPGRQEYLFRFRAVSPGTWTAPPASAFAMYEPACRGRSADSALRIIRKE